MRGLLGSRRELRYGKRTVRGTTAGNTARGKARCPIGASRRVSPGSWVSTGVCASCSCAVRARAASITPSSEKMALN
eukprot:803995-Prymnesium_polylepis.1